MYAWSHVVSYAMLASYQWPINVDAWLLLYELWVTSVKVVKHQHNVIVTDLFCYFVFFPFCCFARSRCHGCSLPLQRSPSRDATWCPTSCADPRLHDWGKTARKGYVHNNVCSLGSALVTIMIKWTQHGYIRVSMHAMSSHSKEMAAASGKALLRKEEVWLCGCSEGRYATWTCPQNHQGPWRHDQQKVPSWQESLFRVKTSKSNK